MTGRLTKRWEEPMMGRRGGFYTRYQRLTARLSGLLVPKGSTMASYNLLVSARHTSKSLSLLIKLVP